MEETKPAAPYGIKTPMEKHGDYSKFHLVLPVSNPVNYESRYRNFLTANESILRKGAHIWCIEMQSGARSHRVTQFENEHHINLWQTALEGECWHKEQLINIAFSHIVHMFPDCRYLCWTDSDFLYEHDMLEKTVQVLQHYPIAQMWSHCVSLDHLGEVLNVFKSFMYCRFHKQCSSHPGYPPRIGSPGGAWAFRREMLNQLGSAISGPILDFAIAGSGDLYFARSVVGEIDKCLNKKFHPNYNKWIKQYGDHADWIVQRNVGYVSNTVRHLFHGKHENRGYDWRNNILKDFKFNPETDLTKDASGLWRLVIKDFRQMGLRDMLRFYNRYRDDDSR